jgi:hypothetical protein
MLSKKDLKRIEEIVQKTVIELLTSEMTWEKIRDDKTGQPLAVAEKKTETVFLPAVLTQVLSFYEGAMRGYQEDLNKNNNKINDMSEKISTIGNILIQTENSLKALASISDKIKLIDSDVTQVIEYKEE